jgi:succinoglycan biosynthesis protein ExoM
LTPAGRAWLFLRALLQSLIAAGLALLFWPGGRHRAVYWMLKVSANLGKMSIFLGWHYREYGRKAT